MTTSSKPPIPVHVLDDRRIHLAPPHHGRLRQGRLKTICGKLAVSELPLFAMAEPKGRCPKCFSALEALPPPAEAPAPAAPAKTRRRAGKDGPPPKAAAAKGRTRNR